jgi:hypothetical protein
LKTKPKAGAKPKTAVSADVRFSLPHVIVGYQLVPAPSPAFCSLLALWLCGAWV